jgi:hypothetical protein
MLDQRFNGNLAGGFTAPMKTKFLNTFKFVNLENTGSLNADKIELALKDGNRGHTRVDIEEIWNEFNSKDGNNVPKYNMRFTDDFLEIEVVGLDEFLVIRDALRKIKHFVNDKLVSESLSYDRLGKLAGIL